MYSCIHCCGSPTLNTHTRSILRQNNVQFLHKTATCMYMYSAHEPNVTCASLQLRSLVLTSIIQGWKRGMREVFLLRRGGGGGGGGRGGRKVFASGSAQSEVQSGPSRRHEVCG